MQEAIAYRAPARWISHAAFPLVTFLFYLSQGALAFFVFKGWWVAAVPLVLLVSHLMHGVLIGFHEATHGSLRKHRWANELDGVLIGISCLISFTLYRVTHQTHHMHLATEKDVELWPFVDPEKPRWARRLAAFIELNLGFFFTPFLFWRVFFQRDSPIRSPRVRRRIWREGLLTVAVWAVVYYVVARYSLWPYFFVNYLIPSLIAGNLQSWRKYVEHVGLHGDTARGATRSIVADGPLDRAISVTLLHEPLHGVHHIKSNIPHGDLPEHAGWLAPEEVDDQPVYPSYRTALRHLWGKLADPKVGKQWLQKG